MQAIETAPVDGTTVDIFFKAGGKVVSSRTRYLPAEKRWNGMCRGETPLGWLPAAGDKPKPAVDPFS